MVELPANENPANRTATPLIPDAHGQAAMLLVESLLHGLIAKSVINVGDAIEIVAIALEVKQEVAHGLGDTPAVMAKSLQLLESIQSSLRSDWPGSA